MSFYFRMTTNDILSRKLARNYLCKTCNYICSKQSDYNKHLITSKHKKNYKWITNNNENSPMSTKNQVFYCECGKKYKYRQGLHKHKKTCFINQGEICKEDNVVIHNSNVSSIDKADITQKLIDLIVTKNQDFMKELVTNISVSNKDVMEKMIEMMPNIGNNTNSHNNITHNTTNNQFNINMFLNEKCKNAMNITDFIESLPVTAETFDNTIENGLTKSITTMITNGLNNMDVLERPIHCTDVNRKTLYVKDNDTWEKDNEMKHLLDCIKDLSIKQRVNISKWHDANEGWETNANLQTRLSALVFHTMEDIENNDKEMGKIIRAISKNTYLSNEVKEQYK
jgi:hypothetical protein